LPRLFCRKASRAGGQEKTDAGSPQQHAKSLAPAFWKMRLQSWGYRENAATSERQFAQDFHFFRSGLT
jgi:hypothetical protein